MLAQTKQLEAFTCEACGREIEALEDVIIETECSYDDDYWGEYDVPWGCYNCIPPANVILSACCRGPVIDRYGLPIEARLIKEIADGLD
jgi:hypothetical protein